MTLSAEKKPEKKRTATREARRQQLIEATIDSISIRGFSATTLSTVTKGANLSHGVVNFHFTNKETLYVETLGYLAQEHYDQWHSAVKNGGDDPVKQLTGLVGADFHPKICSQKKLAVWFAFWGQAKYRPNYLEVHNDYDDQRLANLERLCSEIAEDGGYDHVDPEATARRIEAVIDGLWLQLLLYPKMLNRETAKNDCFAYLSDVFPKHFPRLPITK